MGTGIRYKIETPLIETSNSKTIKKKEIVHSESDTMALSDRQIEIILECFKDPSYTTSASYIIKTLRAKGFEAPERVIRDALLEELLYVERIELTEGDWQDMKLALDEWGESLW